jgi:hypothetical protein
MMQDSEQVLLPELAPGERLLWSGRPGQGLRLRTADAVMIPFSLMWGGFAFFWEFMVVSQQAPLIMRLWGLPFVCIGLYMIVGRFFVDSFLRARTHYGLTSTRVIIVTLRGSRQVKSLTLAGLTDITLSERKDHSGNIVFGPGSASNPFINNRRGATAPSFELIADARLVYERIRGAQHGG